MAKKKEQNWAQAVVDWYGIHKKELPWRGSKDPYKNWVAEVMSQQTQLKTVVPKYNQFLKTLPNLKALAACSEETLRRLWSGLGYYARARNLKKGAAHLLEAGSFPDNAKDWEKVPGVGPYTAAVLASVCNGQYVPCVDGNVIRVVSRMQGMARDVWGTKGQKTIKQFLDKAIVCCNGPGDFNEGMMELGQEVCLKRNPVCSSCPLKNRCTAFKKGIIDLCPPVKKRPQTIDKELVALVVQCGNKVGLVKRGRGFLSQTVGFPIFEEQDQEWNSLKKRLPWEPDKAGVFPHSITKHRIHCTVMYVKADKQGLLKEMRFIWTDQEKVSEKLSASFDAKAWRKIQSKK